MAQTELWRFLSACYYEPCLEFQEERLFDSIVEVASAISTQLAERAVAMRTAFAKENLESLLVDYTRLFLGPMQALASPYEFSWTSAPASTDETPEPPITQLYAQAGFEMGPDIQDRPDHVAIELECLYALSFQVIANQQPDGPAPVNPVANLRTTLLVDHLGVWVPRLADAMEAAARTDFYRELAKLTRDLLALELASVQSRHHSVTQSSSV